MKYYKWKIIVLLVTVLSVTVFFSSRRIIRGSNDTIFSKSIIIRDYMHFLSGYAYRITTSEGVESFGKLNIVS